MKVCLNLNPEQESLLKSLKLVRKTKNSNQIFREALYEYAEKIFAGAIHTGIIKNTDDARKGGQDEN